MEKLQEFGWMIALVIAIVALFSFYSGVGQVVESLDGLNAAVRGAAGPDLGAGSRFPNGISTDSTSPSAGQVRTSTFTSTGNATVSGIFTAVGSYDGFIAGGGVAPASVATTAPITIYTHSGTDAICDASSAVFYGDGTTFAPSLTFDVGTTSTSGGTADNLIASSTLATTTDLVAPADNADLFILTADDEITVTFGDQWATASTTYWANWDVEFGVECWTVGG